MDTKGAVFDTVWRENKIKFQLNTHCQFSGINIAMMLHSQEGRKALETKGITLVI